MVQVQGGGQWRGPSGNVSAMLRDGEGVSPVWSVGREERGSGQRAVPVVLHWNALYCWIWEGRRRKIDIMKGDLECLVIIMWAWKSAKMRLTRMGTFTCFVIKPFPISYSPATETRVSKEWQADRFFCPCHKWHEPLLFIWSSVKSLYSLEGLSLFLDNEYRDKTLSHLHAWRKQPAAINLQWDTASELLFSLPIIK